MASGAGVWHEAGCQTGVGALARLGPAGIPGVGGHHLMTCYLISRNGESIALVADVDMARAIVRCQPWGEYLVEVIEIPDAPLRRPRLGRRAPEDAGVRPRRRPGGPSFRRYRGPVLSALDRAQQRPH